MFKLTDQNISIILHEGKIQKLIQFYLYVYTLTLNIISQIVELVKLFQIHRASSKYNSI